jgi:hypothetical protein
MTHRRWINIIPFFDLKLCRGQRVVVKEQACRCSGDAMWHAQNSKPNAQCCYERTKQNADQDEHHAEERDHLSRPKALVGARRRRRRSVLINAVAGRALQRNGSLHGLPA